MRFAAGPARIQSQPFRKFGRPVVLIALTVASVLPSTTFGLADPEPARPGKRDLPGIENVWRLNDRIWSGGEPGGMEGLRKLKDLGVRAIVSVDGAAPDLDSARKLGLRYVHVPIGYDQVDPAAQLRLVRALSELEGPIYVHCHHGKHRGPAAAAVMARAGWGWSADDAERYMKEAGTSADYPGLYASVRTFRKPTPMELQADREPLPEKVEVPALVEMMVQIDERFDRLKAWATKIAPGSDPKKSRFDEARKEAVLLREAARESARLPECRDKPAEFRKAFDTFDTDLAAWVEAIDAAGGKAKLTEADRMSFGALVKRTTSQCSACHRQFRDK